MKTKFIKALFFCIILILQISYIYSQTQQAQTWSLNGTTPSIVNNNSYDYQARDAIHLTPNFHYQATGNNTFRARINETMVVDNTPVSEQTIPTSVPSGNAIGKINGVFEVSETGSATYNIPIVVPPGTSGMIPSLGIIYNSKGGNGFMGPGWNISGLSAITRVNKNYYNDQKHKSIELAADDAYVLDGQRIFPSGTSGTYFTTEQISYSNASSYESYLTITGIGSTINSNDIISYENPPSSGPLSFDLITKDGKKMIYGGTADSRQMRESTVLTWMLSREIDLNGNYIDYHYIQENGNIRIDHIDYTGNISGQQAYNHIVFVYENRQDKKFSYMCGYKVENNLLLSQIKIRNNDVLVNYYSFDYFFSNNDSRLVKVNQSLNGGANLNSTLITWKHGTIASSEFSLPSVLNSDNIKTGDFDGDGKSEFFITTSTSWKLVDNDMNTIIASGNVDYFNTSFPFDPEYTVVGDFDGDGKDDLFLASKGIYSFTMYFIRLDGNTLIQAGQRYTYPSSSVLFYSGDYDGDGSFEIVIRNNSNSVILYPAILHPINGFSYCYCTPYSGEVIKNVSFNGDGKTELLLNNVSVPNSTSMILLTINQGVPPVMVVVAELLNFTNLTNFNIPVVFSGDFNGDGKSDILTQNAQYNWQVAFSNGKQWTDQSNITFMPTSGNDTKILISDINGDGKDDIIYYFHKNTDPVFYDHDDPDYPNTWDWNEHLYLKVYFSNGDGTFILGINRNENKFFEHVHQNPTIPNPIYTTEKIIICDINGDAKKEIINYASIRMNGYRYFNPSIPYLVENIIDGYNNQTAITYSTLSDATTYTPSTYSNQSNNTYIPLCNSMSVVKKVNFTGLYDYSEVNYNYEGASYIFNKTILGFLKIIKRETREGSLTITTTNNFEQKYNSTWLKNSEQKVGTTVLEYNEYSNNFSTLNTNKKIYKVLPNDVKTTDVNGNLRTLTYDTFDDEGNATQITENIGGDVTNVTKNTYVKYGTWSVFKNRLTSNEVTTTYTNQPFYINKTSNSYDGNGNLLSKTEHDGTTKSVVTNYSMFNGYGLPEKVTVSGNGSPSVETKITSFSYDPKYRFITYMKNPLNQESFKTFDCWGNMLSEKSVTGFTTSYVYDKSNRLVRVLTPEGYEISNTYMWDKQDNIKSLYSATTTTTGKPSSKIWYDDKGREVRKQTDEFSGIVTVDKEFNNIWGTLASESNAYFPGEKFITSYSYNDAAGRLTSSTTLQQTTSFSYPSNKVIITKPNNDEITKTFNAKGDVININAVKGQMSKNIIYTYHSSGNPLTINADGYQSTMKYDDCGRQEELNDPNAGKTSYIYDAYGQLGSQTNALMKTYTYIYDKLGRLITQTGDNDGTITYTYCTSGSGLNQIESEVHSSGTGKHYQYGSYGRLASVTETIDGQPFTTGYHYNQYGMLDKLTYPRTGFVVTNVYNQKSFLTDVLAGSTPIWNRVEETNLSKKYNLGADNGSGSKQIEMKYTYSNIDFTLSSIESKVIGSNPVDLQKFSYNFDLATGNLQWRKDNIRNIQEDFEYDIDRLKNAKISNSTLYSTTYADNGNIISKSDAASVYKYHPIQVNALEKLENYDAANISSDYQEIDYTSFNKASKITEGPIDNPNLKVYDISYGTDQQRNLSRYYYQGQSPKTKYYLPGYEEEIVGSLTRNIHYIAAANGLCAVYIQQSDGNNKLYYVLKDHLSSITGLVNQAGQLEHEYSYDAWGRMRNSADYADYNVTQTTIIGRGYTGHEHLPDFKLINMNGRLYDPVLGRVLSPDNNITDPTNLQSFNRYNYALNNPLKYTDPSGNFPWLTIGVVLLFTYLEGVDANDGKWNPADWGSKNQNGDPIYYQIGGGGNSNGLNSFSMGISTGTPGNMITTNFDNYYTNAPERNAMNSIDELRANGEEYYSPNGQYNKPNGTSFLSNRIWPIRIDLNGNILYRTMAPFQGRVVFDPGNNLIIDQTDLVFRASVDLMSKRTSIEFFNNNGPFQQGYEYFTYLESGSNDYRIGRFPVNHQYFPNTVGWNWIGFPTFPINNLIGP